MQRLWGLAILATMLVGAAAAQQPPIGPGAPGKSAE